MNLPGSSLTSAILCFCSLLSSIYTPRNYSGWKATGSAICSAPRLGQTLLLLYTNANQATLKGNFWISLFARCSWMRHLLEILNNFLKHVVEAPSCTTVALFYIHSCPTCHLDFRQLSEGDVSLMTLEQQHQSM